MFTKTSKLSWMLLIGIGLFSVKFCWAVQKTPTIKQVTILQIVEHAALNATRQGILDVLQDKNIKIQFQSAQGSIVLATQIAQKYVGLSPAVMIGIGTTATQALIAADQSHSIPIVFSSVTDPKGSKIVLNLDRPEGVVTGVSNLVSPALQFDLFKKILPDLTTLGIIYNPGEPNSVMLVEEMQKIAAAKDLKLRLATANTSANIAQATQQLIPQVQAIFINNDNTALSAFDSIVSISTKHKIPVFCSDVDMVDRGALSALGANQYEIGRQTGELVYEIIQGKSPGQLPVIFSSDPETKINADQAVKLGLEITSLIHE